MTYQDKSIYFSQRKYTLDLLEEIGLIGKKLFGTPIVFDLKYSSFNFFKIYQYYYVSAFGDKLVNLIVLD